MNDCDTSDHRRPNGKRLANASRGRSFTLPAVSRADVPIAEAGERVVDNAMSIDPHDVDEVFNRHLFSRSERNRSRTQTIGSSVANCRCADWDDSGAGDSRENDRIRSGFTPAIGAGNMSRRRGQAMLEFALMIPLIILLIGVTVSFGLFFFQSNVLQMAVDVGAQEISRMPFDPTAELGLGRLDKCEDADLVCNEDDFKCQIYDERFLVIRDEDWAGYPGGFQAYVDTELPLLNRLLVPAMIRQCISVAGVNSDQAFWVTRYPGTLVWNQADQMTVLIALVEYARDANGFAGEVIMEWVAPVEEIRVDHDGDPGTRRIGPYSVEKPSGFASQEAEDCFLPGMVALRINYPAQSTTLLNRLDLDDAAKNPNGRRGQLIVFAGDTTVTGTLDDCYTLVCPAGRISPGTRVAGSDPNAGKYGLGELEALQRIVRPYRKVMTFQAIYRREVFDTGTP